MADVKVKSVEKFRSLILKTLADSTVHGVAHFAKQKSLLLQIFWLVCLAASGGVCAWNVIIVIDDYLKYETITKTELITEPMPIPFPAISICSLSRFSTNLSFEFFNELFIENGILKNGSTLEASYPNAFILLLFNFKYLSRVNALNPSISESVKRQFGLDLNSSLLSCLYNQKPCGVDDFEWYFEPYYGGCFLFNGAKSKQPVGVTSSTKAGSLNGLTLELFVGETSSLLSLDATTGVHLIIHNQTEYPSFYKGLDAPAGFQTNIAIRRVFNSKQPQPYSQCTDDTNLINATYLAMFKAFNVSYNRDDCLNLCFQAYLVAECGCYEGSTPF
jgi:hypothetical protein